MSETEDYSKSAIPTAHGPSHEAGGSDPVEKIEHVQTDKVSARGADGLSVEDKNGKGMFIEDGGKVGIGTKTPDSKATICYTDPNDDDTLLNIYSEEYGDDIIRIAKHLNAGGYVKLVVPQGWLGFMSALTAFISTNGVDFSLEGGAGKTNNFKSYLGYLRIKTQGAYNTVFQTNTTNAMLIYGVNQNVHIYKDLHVMGKCGIGTNAPANSALLDLTSTSKALIVTRMTTTQRDAMSAVNGMIIYNTTTNMFNFHENAAWITKN